MLVSIAMYDQAELRSATDSLYACWREHLLARGLSAPAALSWGLALPKIWRDPDLLVAQACGYPFVSGGCGDAQLVATLCYEFPGCQGPFYRSMLIAPIDYADQALAFFGGKRVAVNSWDSYSGFHALRAHLVQSLGPEPFFGSTLISGSHMASLQAMVDGQADLAAIDCVTWGQALRLHPELGAQLCQVGMTERAPGLPLITSGALRPDELRALRASLEDLLVDERSAEPRRELGIVGLQCLEDETYQYIHRQSLVGARMPWGDHQD